MPRAAEEADEDQHQDQRAWRRFGKPEPGQHLVGQQPMMDLDRLLRDVGEHGIGAAEGDGGHLRKEQRLGREYMSATERNVQRGKRQQPDRRPDGDGRHETPGARLRPLRRGSEHSSFASDIDCRAASLGKMCNDPADRRADDDRRKRQLQEGDRDEGSDRQRGHRPTLERPFREPDQRLEHDGEHGSLEPEQQALHDRHIADRQIDGR